MTAAAATGPLAALEPLLDDVGALKRIRRAGSPHSVATALFLRAWSALASRHDADPAALDRVGLETVALALAASQLGAIDGAVLARAGLDAAARLEIVRAAFDRAAAAIEPALAARLRAALRDDADLFAPSAAPAFAVALAEQPRAGATAPGTARLVLEPPENHADHCLAVAVYAMLVAPRYGARGSDAFLFSLAHHLHNAVLPDSGFAGELLLGGRLDAVFERLFEDGLAELDAPLASRLRALRAALLPAAELPEARAFHAADVIDRVLQARHHARAAAFDLGQALDERGLVHEGPVQAFHAGVLAEASIP